MRRLWARRLLQVGGAYLVVAFVLYEAAIFLERALGLPTWLDDAVAGLLLLGFIPALGLAWAGASDGPVTIGGPPRRRAQGTGPASIAVLPFANLSRQDEDEIFADGMVEDLITGLSMNSSIMVVSRSSTFAYKGQSPDVREVAEALGVGFVLEGSVRRTGDNIRVTLQLIEAETGGHVWAEKYDRPLSELFDLQDDLVCELASALGDAMVRAELQRVRRNPASVGAWEESMRALIAQERPTLANAPIAVKHARKAVELDPNFALAHARLAMSLTTHAQLVGGEAAAPMRAEADDEIDKALSLAPNDPKVLGIACGTLAYIGREEEAIRHGARAIALNPHDAPVIGSLANAYFRAGRFAEALPYYAEEARLSPKSPFLASRCVFHALSHVMVGQLGEAEAVTLRGLELDPAFEGAWVALTLIRMMRGDLPAAAEAVRRLRHLNPAMPLDAWLAVIAANIPGPAAPTAAEGFKAAWAASEGAG